MKRGSFVAEPIRVRELTMVAALAGAALLIGCAPVASDIPPGPSPEQIEVIEDERQDAFWQYAGRSSTSVVLRRRQTRSGSSIPVSPITNSRGSVFRESPMADVSLAGAR